MNERLISKYILSELIDSEEESYAIADGNQSIIWFNKGFKKNSGAKRLKGISISNLINSDQPIDFKKNKRKEINITFPTPGSKVINHKSILKIIPLKKGNKIDGFILKLNSSTNKFADKKISKGANRKDSTLHFEKLNNKNQLFPRILQQILTLLLKEKSLSVLSEEILRQCIKVTNSQFGIIVFNTDGTKNLDFQFYTPNGELKNQVEIKREIQGSFPYLSKWLVVNKHSFVAINISDNLGFNIAQALQCTSVVISPCFFDEKLLASIVVGKKSETFADADINNLEQFAVLLSFVISNVRTRELNSALESRLLQSQKLETIGKLSSGMAHDFSNLLSSIFGSINLLKKKIPEREDVYRLLDNIENCSVRAKDLTKGLLSFGKPTPKRKELIKPNSLLSEISKVITQTFPAKINFEPQIEEKLYDILGSGTEIYQVLLNLSVNAKEAIADKGKITLTAKNITIDETNLINFPLLNKGKYVWFSVNDTGAGIKEENISKIFDPYFSTKDKQSGSGSGLGLYVTYGIIKAHQGQVEVSSKINEGTKFDVFIPAFEPTAAVKQTPAEKIILLADDEIMLRDLLSELLESSGYNVIRVSTGVEALKVLTEEIKVNLAIIDYNMPQMDGLECIKQIRDLKFKMPIILSSGSFALGDDFDYRKIGVTTILSKPYEFETMLSTIQKLI